MADIRDFLTDKPTTIYGGAEVMPSLSMPTPASNNPVSITDFLTAAPPTNSPVNDKTPDRDPGLFESFTGGLSGGLSGLVTAGVGLQALGSEVLGSDDNEYIPRYLRREQRDSANRNEFTTWDEVKNATGSWDTVERFGEWMAYATGEQLPNIGAIVGGAVTGGSSASLAVANTLGKAMLKNQISKKVGQAAGAFVASASLEAGHITGEQIGAVGEINAPVALTAGVISGILEAATPIAIGRAANILGSTGDEFLQLVTRYADGAISRAARGTVKGAAMETATEVLQESVAITARSLVDENYSWASEDVRKRLEESAVTAFFTGGAISGASVFVGEGIQGRRADPRQLERIRKELEANKPKPFLPDLLGKDGVPTVPTVPTPVTPASDLPDVSPDALYSKLRVKNSNLTPEDTRDAPLAVVSKESLGKDMPQVMEFSGAHDVDKKSALISGDRKSQTFIALKEGENASDVTAIPSAIPADIRANNPNITFTKEMSPQAMDKLLTDVNIATAMLTSGRKDTVEKGKVLYSKAIVAGFRYQPQKGEGFFLLDGSVENLVISRGPQELRSREGLYLSSKTNAIRRVPDTITTHVLRPEALRDLPAKVLTEGNITGIIREVLQIPLDSDIEVIARKWEETFAQEGYIYDTNNLMESLQKWKNGGWRNNGNDRYGLYFRTPNASASNLTAIGIIPERYKDKIINVDFPGSVEVDKSLDKDISLINVGKEIIEVTVSKENPIHFKINGKRHKVDTKNMDNFFILGKGARKNTVQLIETNEINSTHKEIVKELHEMTKKLQRQLAKGTSINLLIYNNSTGNRSGFFLTSPLIDQDTMTIAINMYNSGSVNELNQRERIFTTFAHEFGHLLSHRYLRSSKVEKGLANELVNAHLQWLQRLKTFPLDEVSGEGFSANRGVIIHRGVHAGIDSKTMSLEALKGSLTKNAFDYYTSFEEYMAEQMVLYVQSGRSGLTGTEKFFDYIISAMKKVLRTVWGETHKGVKYSHSSAFEAMMDFVKERSKENSKKGTYLDILDSVRNSPEVWNKELGAYIDEHSVNMARRVKVNISKSVSESVMSSVSSNGKTTKQNLDDMAAGSDYFNSMVKWGYNVFQLAKNNTHISLLGDYISKADEWLNEKSRMQNIGNEIVRQWQGLGQERSDRVSQFLFELDAFDKHPTLQELEVLIKKHNMDEAMLHIYNEVKTTFSDMLKRMEETAIAQLGRSFNLGSVDYNKEKMRINDEFDRIRTKPYFPHSRFGNYAVIGTNANGKVEHMETVEANAGKAFSIKTPREVDEVANTLRKAYPELTFGVSLIPEPMRIYQGMPPAIIQKISQYLAPSLTQEDQKWLQTLSIQYAPGTSHRKRMLKRSNVSGFDKDGIRGFANYVWHGSNHIARITYGKEMEDVVDALRKEVSNGVRGGLDMSNRSKIVNYLDRHLDYVLNPKPDWAAARSLAFTWWLGFSPASAVLNFTQLPMVTYPHLATNMGGDLKASAAILRAGKNVRKMYTKGVTGSGNNDVKLAELAVSQGIFGESFAKNLAGIAEGSNIIGARSGSALAKGMLKFGQVSSFLFSASEGLNRRVTFYAAVDLARKEPYSKYLNELRDTMRLEYADLQSQQGLSATEAIAFLAGKDSVRTTQFEYSAVARPEFMRGKVKATALTFQMYTQNMLWLVAHSKSNKRMLLVMLAMGGLMGLPGAEDMDEIVEFIGRKLFGVRFSMKEEIGKFVSEVADPKVADMLLHGTAREGFGMPALGDMLGLPIPRFDMSGNVSMGSIVPGLAAALNNDKGSFESNMGKAAIDVAGATAGIGINAFKFFNNTQLPLSDIKRLELIMPRALRNVTKAMRFLPPDSEVARVTGAFVTPEGMERGKGGEVIIPFEGNNAEHMMEIAIQAIGFTPTRLSKRWNEIIERSEVVGYWQTRRSLLFTQFSHSLYTKDTEERESVLSAIRRYNRAAPYPEMRISGKDIRESMRARRRIMLRRNAGIEDTRRYRRLGAEISQRYEDDTVVSREEIK